MKASELKPGNVILGTPTVSVLAIFRERDLPVIINVHTSLRGRPIKFHEDDEFTLNDDGTLTFNWETATPSPFLVRPRSKLRPRWRPRH